MFNRMRKKPLKVKVDLTQGNILKKLLVVAMPMLLTSIVQLAYNLTDMFWVARVDQLGQIPSEAVSAVGTAGFFAWFGFGLILIAKVGVSIKVSQSAGKDDRQEVDRHATNGLIIMLALGIIFSAYGVFFGRSFINIFRIDNVTVVQEGVTYLRIISAFGVAYFLVNLFGGVYDGLGKTINTFYITASGLVLNMILDPIFILVLGLGVTGAAVATGLSQTFVLLTFVVIFVSKRRPATIAFKRYLSWAHMRKIFLLGLPVGIQSMTMTSIAIMLGVMIAAYGPNIISVSSIGSQIEALSWMVASGFQVAMVAFIGQNFGARAYQRIKLGYLTSMAMLIPYGLAVNALLFFGARWLFGLFIPTEPTLSQGAEYLKILSISQVFMIIEMVTAGAFNGLGKTTLPSIIQFIGNAMRVPLAIILTTLIVNSVHDVPTVHGIWWALTISSVFKGSLMVTLFVIWITRFYRRLPSLSVEKTHAV